MITINRTRLLEWKNSLKSLPVKMHRGIMWATLSKKVVGVAIVGNVYEYTFRFRTDFDPHTTHYEDRWFITNEFHSDKAAVQCINANWGL